MTSRAPIDKCVNCGEPESEHHEFVAVTVPTSCRCAPGSWGGVRISDVCSAYVQIPAPGATRCAKCEHDEECHEVKR